MTIHGYSRMKGHAGSQLSFGTRSTGLRSTHSTSGTLRLPFPTCGRPQWGDPTGTVPFGSKSRAVCARVKDEAEGAELRVQGCR